MAVSYPLTIPPSPGFGRARFELVSNVAVFESPLSRVEQVLERDGARWSAVFTVATMRRGADTGAWTAFFSSLRGRRGTFNGYDPLATSPRGSAGGTPLVKGAGQTGNSLITDGWPANQSGVLLKGDYIQVNARFHMVVEDADSDGGGNATLEIEPKVRESPPDNAAITTTNPKVKMRLIDNRVGWDEALAQIYGFSFAAMEVL